MSNNEQEEEKEEQEQSDEDLEDLSKEELLKKKKELEAQKRHWREKAQQDEEDEDDDEDSSTQEVDPNEIQELKEDLNKVKRSEKKRKFQHKHNLSPKQVDFLFRKSDGDPEEEMDKPAMKAALNEIESQEKVEENTPSSSSTNISTSNQTDKDYDELTEQEKQKLYEERQKERGVL